MLTDAALATGDRPLVRSQLLQQIGRGNLLAISGGRTTWVTARGPYGDETKALVLPVGSGYSVRITLSATDTYTVERVFTRKKQHTIYRMTDVYSEDISEVAYFASCFRNVEWGEKVEG